jgi:hypothetical protein
MNKNCILIAVIAACAAAASAFGWGSLISSFHSPSNSTFPNGLGYRADNLYIASNVPGRIWQTSLSGSVVQFHNTPAPGPKGCTVGVIGGTSYCWVVSHTPQFRIYQVDSNSGSVYRSFEAPGAYPMGLAFQRSGSSYYLYYTDTLERRLYRMNATTGSVYASYPLSFAPSDLGYGDGYLWINDATNSRLRKCSLTAVTTYDYFSLSAYGFPSACAYDEVRNEVWVGINEPMHSVLRFTADSGTGVVPSSVGKIKALFE